MTILSVSPEVWWWLGIGVALAGVVVSALHVRQTRWTLVLIAGFAADMLVATFYRLTTGPAYREIAGLDICAAQRIASLVAVCGRMAMVIGVAGVLNVARARGTTRRAPSRA
jgi:hypothetical protein